MLTLFNKKRTAASSARLQNPSTTLKPLLLVDKLVAENVIAQPMLKKSRWSLPAARPLPVKASRPSLPAQVAGNVRAPFVVPLRMSTRAAPRASTISQPSVAKPPLSRRPVCASKPAPVPKAIIPVSRPRATSKPVVETATKSKPRLRGIQTDKRPQNPPLKNFKVETVEKLKSPKQPGARSRIPVFVGRSSAGTFTPSSTPRSGSSRIPRLKYASSPSSASSTSSGSMTSFDLNSTPCPSPSLVVETRPAAVKIVIFKTVEVRVAVEADTTYPETATQALEAPEVEEVSAVDVLLGEPTTVAPETTQSDNTSLSSSGNAEIVCLEATAPEDAVKMQEKETVEAEEDGGGIMGQLMGELKNCLSWGKTKNTTSPYTIDRFGRRRPTSINSSNENTAPETTSELQQAFARRQSTTASGTQNLESMKKQNENTATRKPLAPLNPNITGSFVPTLDILNSLVTDPTPPGAEEDFVVTELVSTLFGTRRVRRLVIPPMLEGAQPSRDPKIINELKSLRAQQKVVAGVEKVGGGAEKIINVGSGCV